MPFGRPGQQKPEPKPTTMRYTGDNGPDVADWGRDGDLSPRFVAPHLDQPARAKVQLDNGQGDTWIIVAPGSTLHDDGNTLVVELPAPDLQEDQA